MDPQQSILKLNDDCLYIILEKLELHDLCSIGSTCKRLNQLAAKFYNRYTNLDISMFSTNGTKFNLISEPQMELIVKQIGKYVRSFHAYYTFSEYCDVDYPGEIETLVRLILQYCSNLSELKLAYIGDDSVILEICQTENIKKLETIDLTISNRDNTQKNNDIVICLGNLPKLKNLTFNCRNDHINTQLFKKFNNLESFSPGYLQLQIDIWIEICANNPVLKSLEIWTSCSSELFNLIIENLVWIERLELRMLRTGLPLIRLAQLKYLKHLKLNECLSVLNLDKLAELDQLESIDLNGSNVNMSILAKFTKLKHLIANGFQNSTLNALMSKTTVKHIDINRSYDVTEDGLLEFVNDAQNLKYLAICECYLLSGNTITLLNNLVASQRRKLTLYCDIHGGYERIDFKYLDIQLTKYERYPLDDFFDD